MFAICAIGGHTGCRSLRFFVCAHLKSCLTSAIGPNSFMGRSENGRKLPAHMEAAGAVAFRIDDHSKCGDLASRGAVEGISQEKPAVALSLVTTIHGEPAQSVAGASGYLGGFRTVRASNWPSCTEVEESV